MKKAFVIISVFVALCTFTGNSFAQEKQKARISLLKQTGNTVALTVSSPSEFYVGGNKHILYIGDKFFDLYDQANDEGKGSLIFYIPIEDYKFLRDGTKVYLSYGELEVQNEKELEEICQQDFSPCWLLGKLNKRQLKY